MATPPRIARAEMDAAITRIASRHRKIDDELFANVDLDKPADVLDYLRKHLTRIARIVRWVAQADVSDALILHVWNWWEDRRREHELLMAGKRLGLPLSQLGSPLGIGSRVQSDRGNRRRGTQDRLDRLEALLRFDRPDAELVREARRVDQAADEQANEQTTWLVKHRAWMASTAAALLAYAHLADEDAAEDLAAVRDHWREDRWTPGALVWMGMATAALRASERVIELGPRHGVHRALKAVDELRVAFAELRDHGTVYARPDLALHG
jgi:hypothetical protein